MNIKVILGAGIMLLFMGWGVTSFLGSTAQYVSIAEARTSDRAVQVLGQIATDQVIYDAQANCLRFAIYPPETTQPGEADFMNVVYYGVVPGNFDQAKSVVVRGRYEENTFVAEKMLIKCPSKYQGSGGEGYQDLKRHEENAPKVTQGA